MIGRIAKWWKQKRMSWTIEGLERANPKGWDGLIEDLLAIEEWKQGDPEFFKEYEKVLEKEWK